MIFFCPEEFAMGNPMTVGTVGMCWLLLMVSYGELQGVKAQDAEGKDWFEVEVTLANSDFVDGDEGWEVIGEAAELRAESNSISALDEGSHLWFFSAPTKFLGDVRHSFGCRLTYSLGHYHSDSAGRQPTMVEDVVLISDLHNMTLLRSGVIKPWTYSSNVEVQLDGSGRWTHAMTGETASDDDMKRVLSSLSGLLIRGGYYHGRETTWLKDVYVGKKQRVQRSNAASNPSMRPEDVPVPPSLSYTSSMENDIRLPAPPRSTRPRPPPRAPDSAELESGDVVSRALYDDLKDLKEEFERSDQQLRGAVAELQGRLAASQDENRRLRAALVQAIDKGERNGELADARTRNFKQCDKALAEAKTELAATSKRLAASDELRRQKQITIEELYAAPLSDSGSCERLQEKLNDCKKESEAAEQTAKDASLQASVVLQQLAASSAEVNRSAGELELCSRRVLASTEAASEVRAQLAVPLQRMMEQLTLAQSGLRSADEKLAVACLTRQAQFVTAAGGLLVVPFGVALMLGAPVLMLRGRLRSGLTAVANVGDLIVLLFWLASYAILSFRDEMEALMSKYAAHEVRETLRASLQPLLELHKSLGPGAEHYLHLCGGCMYGLALTGAEELQVVGVHLLSLFSAPDVMSTLQAFAFWGVGLHYFHGLSGGGGGGGGGGGVAGADGLRFARGTAGGGGAAAGLGERGGWVSTGVRGARDQESHLLIYIATMSLLVALRARPGAARGGRGAREGEGGEDARWRPVGGVQGRGRRRGRVARRREYAYEEEVEEEELDVSEGEGSEQLSPSDEEEEEEALRFPRDEARDESMSVAAFAKDFLGKYPGDSTKRSLEAADGRKLEISKQFVRDVPTMLRVNGRKVSGETDEQRAVEAYDVISSACACISKQPAPKGQKKGARELALARPEQVVAVANQNLGIFLYEQVVKRFEKEDASVAVLQAGHHYIDIRVPQEGALQVSLVAYFKLHKSDDLDVQPWLMQATVVVDIGLQKVDIEFSKAVPSPSDLQASIQRLEGRTLE